MKRFIIWSAPAAALVSIALWLLPLQPSEAQSTLVSELVNGLQGVEDYSVVIGSPAAAVTIEEYASLSCPHCAKFHNDILPALMEPYIASGKAKIVWHSFVRNEPDLKGTMLLHCLENNDRRIAFLKVLFKMQDRWAFESEFLPALSDIARAGGMSKEAFDGCMADTELEIAVLGDRKTIADSGKVKSTPTFYVGGQEVMGARPAEEFSRLIDQALVSGKKPVNANLPPAPSQAAPAPVAPAAPQEERRPVNQDMQ